MRCNSHFSAKASISASARINITTSASASATPPSLAPSLTPAQRLSSMPALAHPPATQCDLCFNANASARMSVSASQKNRQCSPIVRTAIQVPAPSHQNDAIICNTTHLGKFLLCHFFSYISGFAAMQQQQHSSSNNSSNAVTGR
jgi:hypothetical protein